MNRSLLFFAVLVAAIAPSALAQTGRTMKLMAPVVLGHTASMVLEHPPALAGRPFAMAMCSPSHPGALPLSIPGVVEGVLRLDPLGYGVLGIGVLDASGRSPALTFPVPNDPLLVGAAFDVQGADVDDAGLITLSDNDLEIEVAEPPPSTLNMVPIAPGTFSMGAPVDPSYPPTSLAQWTQPVHQVTITRPFWMGRYEVTQAEFQALMGTNPSHFQGANLPVDRPSWYQAVSYCEALTVQEAAAGRLPSGYEYRLPTEAEWEYCCRAGTTTEFHVGDDLDCVHANFKGLGYANCTGGTTPGGTYPANAWGLHDMHGNLNEWCLDSFAAYSAEAVSDPYVLTDLAPVIRGGNWNYIEQECRSAFRSWMNPGFTMVIIGFRVVCAPQVP